MMQTVLLTAALGPYCVGAARPVMAGALIWPTLVLAGPKRFAHDDADTVRHAERKAYERLAKEDALADAVRKLNAEFRRHVNPNDAREGYEQKVRDLRTDIR